MARVESNWLSVPTDHCEAKLLALDKARVDCPNARVSLHAIRSGARREGGPNVEPRLPFPRPVSGAAASVVTVRVKALVRVGAGWLGGSAAEKDGEMKGLRTQKHREHYLFQKQSVVSICMPAESAGE